MKKLLFKSSLLIGILFAFQSNAQQLENGDFENWENLGTATEEPTDWSSLKTADALAASAPQVLNQDAGRIGGSSVRLEVLEAFFIPVNGLMTNGRVHADFDPENGYVYTEETDAQWHTPFTYKPDSIVGYYKYAPTGGDKGKVEIVLHTGECQLPFGGFEQNIVARAKTEFTSSQPNWVRFSAPFTYYNSNDPAYVLVTVAAGDSTVSVPGTILWVDDFELIYNNPVGIAQLENEIDIWTSNGKLNFIGTENEIFNIYSLTGQRVYSGQTSPVVELTLSGLFLVQVETNSGQVFKKIYLN